MSTDLRSYVICAVAWYELLRLLLRCEGVISFKSIQVLEVRMKVWCMSLTVVVTLLAL